jgi:hypothetical protein
MKKLVLIYILFGLVTSLQAQITLIPDPYFEGVLVGNGIDSDGEINGQALTSDLEAVTQLLIFDQQLITDVTGIEAFINLEKLRLTNMGITHLDLSNAVLLEELRLGNNSLLELDLSNNINLENLIIQFNCASCQFYSPLNTLDLSNNLLLNQLLIFDTEIINLDLSNNPDIGFIEITRNNSLNSINFKNGNNSQTFWLQFTDNSNLECVQVDDPEAVIAGVDPPYDNWVIENDPIISEDCFLGMEENKLNKITIYPNPVKSILRIESQEPIKKVSIYNLLGSKLLEVLDNFNEITMADLPAGILLVEIETQKGVTVNKVIKE